MRLEIGHESLDEFRIDVGHFGERGGMHRASPMLNDELAKLTAKPALQYGYGFAIHGLRTECKHKRRPDIPFTVYCVLNRRGAEKGKVAAFKKSAMRLLKRRSPVTDWGPSLRHRSSAGIPVPPAACPRAGSWSHRRSAPAKGCRSARARRAGGEAPL